MPTQVFGSGGDIKMATHSQIDGGVCEGVAGNDGCGLPLQLFSKCEIV